MNPTLLERYNVPVPRYTSYPPANHFAPLAPTQYIKALDEANAPDSPISIYIHIPFCHHLCHYCGCNSYPMQGPEAVRRYVEAIKREFDLMAPHID